MLIAPLVKTHVPTEEDDEKDRHQSRQAASNDFGALGSEAIPDAIADLTSKQPADNAAHDEAGQAKNGHTNEVRRVSANDRRRDAKREQAADATNHRS